MAVAVGIVPVIGGDRAVGLGVVPVIGEIGPWLSESRRRLKEIRPWLTQWCP
jgi:hypothetical protein